MDFKFGDDVVDGGVFKRGLPNGIKMTITIVVALIVGVSVFLVSNHFFGEKKEETPEVTTIDLSVDDATVKNVYKYVTYGVLGVRNDKFIKEQNVTVDTFSNIEKFYYAMMFAKMEDFSNTGNKDSNGLDVYSISNERVRTYMRRYFGNSITYTTNEPIIMTFNFDMGDKNKATMSYDSTRDGFLTTFSEKETPLVDTSLVKPYYTKLTKATNGSDGKLKLIENIIYVSLEQLKDASGNLLDSYSINIYKDYAKTDLIESRSNMTKKMIEENPLDVSSYVDKAGKITYTFAHNSSGYYFVSSEIE